MWIGSWNCFEALKTDCKAIHLCRRSNGQPMKKERFRSVDPLTLPQKSNRTSRILIIERWLVWIFGSFKHFLAYQVAGHWCEVFRIYVVRRQTGLKVTYFAPNAKSCFCLHKSVRKKISILAFTLTENLQAEATWSMPTEWIQRQRQRRLGEVHSTSWLYWLSFLVRL